MHTLLCNQVNNPLNHNVDPRYAVHCGIRSDSTIIPLRCILGILCCIPRLIILCLLSSTWCPDGSFQRQEYEWNTIDTRRKHWIAIVANWCSHFLLDSFQLQFCKIKFKPNLRWDWTIYRKLCSTECVRVRCTYLNCRCGRHFFPHRKQNFHIW